MEPTTFAEDIEQVAGDEQIESAVIGDMGWPGYGDNDRHAAALTRRGELLPWSVARTLLDYKYDDSFGAPDCNAVYAWTETRVLFIVQYDGSTNVYHVPRNPVVVMPRMPGG